jgi:hypothetical protein
LTAREANDPAARGGANFSATRIDKKASLTNSKVSDHKTPAEEIGSRLLRRAGAEGVTAPETLRPTDRSGMTLWKAIFHV